MRGKGEAGGANFKAFRLGQSLPILEFVVDKRDKFNSSDGVYCGFHVGTLTQGDNQVVVMPKERRNTGGDNVVLKGF
jgi:hypothetical protein